MLTGRHLIQPDDLSVSEIEEICSLAEQIIVDPKSFNDVCRGKILATLFFEPSTRTRLSFEAAMLELGGSVKFLLPGEGRSITLRRDFKGDLEWDHPLRYFLLGVVLSLGGVAAIVSCLRAPEKPANTGKKKKRKKK